MELSDDQVEVLKEIPGYIRRDMLYEWISVNLYPNHSKEYPHTWTDYKRGFNHALGLIKANMDAGVI